MIAHALVSSFDVLPMPDLVPDRPGGTLGAVLLGVSIAGLFLIWIVRRRRLKS